MPTQSEDRQPDLGDLVVLLLAGTLAGLRDKLAGDGYVDAATFVDTLVTEADDYVSRIASR